MYETHYNFTGSPFHITPDARFFYGSRGHNRAVAHLTFGLAQGEGFIIVTGDAGAGKTLLIERLRSQLNHDTYAVACLHTTLVSGDDLLRLVLGGFGVDDSDANGAPAGKAALLRHFEDMLRGHHQAGRRCLLIVDEAQNLSPAALEELRLLSNFSANGRALLQIILMGQPQLRRLLAGPDLDPLRQRVLASYHLGPLTGAETRAYIEHRLSTVGWHDNPHWEDAAFAAVHDHSGGIPRRINRLCGRVLLYGALEQSPTITGPMVGSTAEELDKDLEGLPAAQLARLAPPPAMPPAEAAPDLLRPDLLKPDLLRRVETLEQQVAGRERVFRRLTELFAAAGAR